MSETPAISFEHQTEKVRYQSQTGMEIECQTTVGGDSGMDRALSQDVGEDLVASSSVWHFMGPRRQQTAETIARTVNMFIAQTPDAKGRYAAFCREGQSETETPTGVIVEPFAAVLITGRADQASPEEVTDFSYRAMEKMNTLLAANDHGFQIPLPPADQQPQAPQGATP